MNIRRRELFKIAATGLISLASSSALGEVGLADNESGQSLGVLVDTAVCIGCRKCEWACNQYNKLNNRTQAEFDDKSVFQRHRRPDHSTYTVVNQFQAPGQSDKAYYIKVQCMHCIKPACASACLVGALTKDKSGPVVYDAWKCIGCRYCMVACPFQIPAYEYDNAFAPQVRKCTFCFEKVIREGLKPSCVDICPNDALTFGKRDDLIDAAYVRMKAAPDRYIDHVYGEHEAGGTNWLYLAPIDFANTELPKLESKPIPEITENIQHGIFKSFVPPLALYGLLGLAMHALKDKKDSQEQGHDKS
jgi:formate dehydrogenase iron-sulfur subunit